LFLDVNAHTIESFVESVWATKIGDNALVVVWAATGTTTARIDVELTTLEPDIRLVPFPTLTGILTGNKLSSIELFQDIILSQ
jgi:hypothetical protein